MACGCRSFEGLADDCAGPPDPTVKYPPAQPQVQGSWGEAAKKGGAGAASGAATGAGVAGPAGAIVGGVIGALIGGWAGAPKAQAGVSHWEAVGCAKKGYLTILTEPGSPCFDLHGDPTVLWWGLFNSEPIRAWIDCAYSDHGVQREFRDVRTGETMIRRSDYPPGDVLMIGNMGWGDWWYLPGWASTGRKALICWRKWQIENSPDSCPPWAADAAADSGYWGVPDPSVTPIPTGKRRFQPMPDASRAATAQGGKIGSWLWIALALGAGAVIWKVSK